MKIRNGFVSNSSSTSFTFVIRGNTVDDLFLLMRKYKDYFDLYSNFDDYIDAGVIKEHCDVEDVINSVRDRGIGDVSNDDISYYLTRNGEDLRQIRAELERENVLENRQQWYITALARDEYEKAEERFTLEELQKKGFTNVITIDFGDNHGDVSGGTVGYLMDYEGRNIYINKPDFVVWTTQNR